MVDGYIKDRVPFQKEYLEDSSSDVIALRLNSEDREMLNNAKLVMKQQKDSTAIKQLARLGSNVLHDPKTLFILDTIFNNERRNRRIGIDEIDVKQ